MSDLHSDVPRPPKELKGFSKVSLQPGETQRVTVELDQRSFAYYDVNSRDWEVTPGTFEVLVGRSSKDIVLRSKLRYTE